MAFHIPVMADGFIGLKPAGDSSNIVSHGFKHHQKQTNILEGYIFCLFLLTTTKFNYTVFCRIYATNGEITFYVIAKYSSLWLPVKNRGCYGPSFT